MNLRSILNTLADVASTAYGTVSFHESTRKRLIQSAMAGKHEHEFIVTPEMRAIYPTVNFDSIFHDFENALTVEHYQNGDTIQIFNNSDVIFRSIICFLPTLIII